MRRDLRAGRRGTRMICSLKTRASRWLLSFSRSSVANFHRSLNTHTHCMTTIETKKSMDILLLMKMSSMIIDLLIFDRGSFILIRSYLNWLDSWSILTDTLELGEELSSGSCTSRYCWTRTQRAGKKIIPIESRWIQSVLFVCLSRDEGSELIEQFASCEAPELFFT